MKSWKMVCIMSCGALLGGCTPNIQTSNLGLVDVVTSDLVSPPYEDHPNIQAAEIARRRGDVPQAIRDYRDIIKQCPGCEKAYVGLGMSLIDANALVEAKHTFEKAITLFPRSSKVYAGLGLVYILIDQPENAISYFDNALKLNPRNANAYNGYGMALDMIDEHETAQANYRAALELDPTNISYESNLALSMALCGNVFEAIHILERLVSSPNVTPRIRQNLSLAYGLAGDTKMAKKIGRMDLSDDMVMNNVTYFEAIQQTRQYSGLIPKDNTTPLDETRRWQERN
jgi:Flp pilus assembly protein TadD